MTPFSFILSVFAVYRVGHILSREDGPFAVFAKLREAVITRWKIGSWQAEGIQCLWCETVWLSSIPALIFSSTIVDFLLNFFAVAGAVLVIDILLNQR